MRGILLESESVYIQGNIYYFTRDQIDRRRRAEFSARTIRSTWPSSAAEAWARATSGASAG